MAAAGILLGLYCVNCCFDVVLSGISHGGGVLSIGETRRSDDDQKATEINLPLDIQPRQASADVSHDVISHGNETFEHEATNHSAERYHVAKFDFAYVDTPFLVSLWILFASIAKIAFHKYKKLARLFPESCVLILIGIGLGVILHFSHANDDHYQLNTRTFFLVILPPIIIDAGYFMPIRPFFDQFGTIVLYAVLGTMMNALCIGFTLWAVSQTSFFSWGLGLQALPSDAAGGVDAGGMLPLLHALVFASLLAAVDPVAVLAVFDSLRVNEVLHIVVFGESLLNDGISVVLYRMFEGFSLIGMDNIILIDVVYGIISFFVVIVGSTLIGVTTGFGGGFASRFTSHFRVVEPLVVFVVCYMSFLLAEMFHLSGILACTFCGISLRKYAEPNLSHKSQTTIKFVMKIGASVSETIIFMYLGIAAVSDTRRWNTAFIVLTLVLCLVYRAIGVIILTSIANRVRLVRLGFVDQFIMSYGGLRGAIAFALAVLLDERVFPDRHLFITTTIVVIYFTNFVMGSTMQPLVKLLRVKLSQETKSPLNEKIAHRLIDHMMSGIENIIDQGGRHSLRERFSRFSNSHLKGLVNGNHQSRLLRGTDIVSVYRQVIERDTRRLAETTSYGRHRSVLVGRLATKSHWPTTHSFCSSAADVNSDPQHSKTTATSSFYHSIEPVMTAEPHEELRQTTCRCTRHRSYSIDCVTARCNSQCHCVCHCRHRSIRQSSFHSSGRHNGHSNAEVPRPSVAKASTPSDDNVHLANSKQTINPGAAAAAAVKDEDARDLVVLSDSMLTLTGDHAISRPLEVASCSSMFSSSAITSPGCINIAFQPEITGHDRRSTSCPDGTSELPIDDVELAW